MKKKAKITRDYYYICETCNAEFPHEQGAKRCEKRHRCEHISCSYDYQQYYDESSTLEKVCNECGYEEVILLQQILEDNPVLAEAIFNLLKKEKTK